MGFVSRVMLQNRSQLSRLVTEIVPELIHSAHKGQAGRLGIVGGSLEYTGAPYFAAMTALRVGADLTHVFCARDAATPIKCYSPELIVHPVLDATDPLAEIEEWLPRLHTLILGPGLGRRPQIFATLGHILEAAKDRNLLLVLDADALFYLNENYDTITGYTNAILTPNKIEFARLYRAVMKVDMKADSVTPAHVQHLAGKLGVTIACKGSTDIIASAEILVICDVEGSDRRCGGQGDILSGAAGVLLYWAYGTVAMAPPGGQPPVLPPTVVAAWGACALTRYAARLAWEESGRGTLTSDILRFVAPAFKYLFRNKPEVTQMQPGSEIPPVME